MGFFPWKSELKREETNKKSDLNTHQEMVHKKAEQDERNASDSWSVKTAANYTLCERKGGCRLNHGPISEMGKT